MREVQNSELTQQVRLTDGMPDIGRVLTAWGQVVVRSKQWRSDAATVSGGVMAWILYAPEDGSEPRSVDVWVPFELSWELPQTERDGVVQVVPLVRFVDSRTLSARKMMLRIGIAAKAEALVSGETEVFRAEEAPEDVELLKNTYPLLLPREAGEKIFQFDEELTLPASVPALERILAYSVQPEVSENKVMANKVVFRGSCALHIVYSSPDGRVQTWDFELPFSQIAELEGEYGTDARADICPVVTSLELDKGDDGLLRVKCGVVAQYLVHDRQLLELTQDAYSPVRQVELRQQTLSLPALLEMRREVLSVEQSLPGQEGETVDIAFFPDFPRQHGSADSIELEIPGLFQVLYRGEDGALQSANARWEGALSLPIGEDAHVDVIVSPIGRPVTKPSADGMMLGAQVALHLDTTAEGGMPMLTGLTLGEVQQPDPARASLILRRMGTEGLWDLAKSCGSTVEAIRSANALQEEPEPGRMMLIPIR